MARGNNGNLLQHFIECEIARCLTKELAEGSLHVVFTHGMAPHEPFEAQRNSPHRALDRCLLAAKLDESGELGREFAVVEAYRETRASADSYPNSAELVASIVGGDKALHGLICETCAPKQAALTERWSGSEVSIHRGSWRKAKADLTAPADLQSPWLFSMDPFTFSERSFSDSVDDGNLDASDLDRVKCILSGYLQVAQPGALCVFCYSLRPCMQRVYKDAICQVFGKLKVRFVETCARGGNNHIGALVSPDGCMLEAVKQRWQDIFSRLS